MKSLHWFLCGVLTCTLLDHLMPVDAVTHPRWHIAVFAAFVVINAVLGKGADQ